MRTSNIYPPSVRAETINVIKAAAAIVFIVVAYVFRPTFGAPDVAMPVAGVLPYQKLIRDASQNEQRVYRELQEGLLEAERMRAETGRWPDVTALETEGIPPFAGDPTQ